MNDLLIASARKPDFARVINATRQHSGLRCVGDLKVGSICTKWAEDLAKEIQPSALPPC
jgi:hypothetical protein